MADTDPKAGTATHNAPTGAGIPGSASRAHPTDGIPLPAHGFDNLDDLPVGDLATISAGEITTRAAVLLLSGAAEKLGLNDDGEPYPDLDEARRLITALAGLLAAAGENLGGHAHALRNGLTSLQAAFREASRYPDEPGQGPGEQFAV